MIPAPREVFEVLWNGAAWRAPAPPPASKPEPEPAIRFRGTRRQVLAARNRAPHTRATAKRRLWAALTSPRDVDTLAGLSGLTRAAVGAWIWWPAWRKRITRRALSGIMAAVVGVIANLSLWFALHVIFAKVGLHGFGPLTVTLPDPTSWQIDEGSRYVHICGNETIHGVEFHELPDLKALGCDAPLVVDFSSHVASRPVDWTRVGLAFGGAQKNLGPAGLTLVIVREDLIGRALSVCPSAFDYKLVADNQSMYNTPPTYSIYIAGLVFQWLKAQTEGQLSGIAAMEQRNIAKAELLYRYIDGSQLYVNKVDKACRSRMNVPFFLRGDDGQPLVDPAHPRNAAFLTAAKAAGLLQLKGHKSVGGMRASIYNAMPIEGVQALIACMREFEAKGA